jgi:hypothetical protein
MRQRSGSSSSNDDVERAGVNDHRRFALFGTLGKGDGVLDGVEVGSRGTTRDQHKIGQLQRMQVGGIGVPRRVDQDDIGPLLPSLLHEIGQMCCASTYHRRAFGGAAVAPFGGGGLRVNVEQGNGFSVTRRTDGKMGGNRTFTRSAFLAE